MAVLGALAGVASLSRIGPGVIGMRHDWATAFTREAVIGQSSELAHAWSGWGTGSPVVYPTIWIHNALLAGLAIAGFTPDIISRLDAGLWIALAFWSAAVMARVAFGASVPAAIGMALLYAGSTVVLNKIASGHTPLMMSYALLPLVLVFFHRAITSTSRRDLIAAGAATVACAAIDSTGVQYVVLVPVALLAYGFANGNLRRTIAITAGTALAIIAIQATTVVSVFGQGSYLGEIGAQIPDDWITYNSPGLANSAGFGGYPPHFADDAYASFGLGYAACRLVAAAVVVGLALAAFVAGHRPRTIAAASLAYAAGVVFTAGTKGSPVAALLGAAYKHVPGFLLFREPYNAAALPALAAAALLALSCGPFAERSKPRAAVAVGAVTIALLATGLDWIDAIVLTAATAVAAVIVWHRPPPSILAGSAIAAAAVLGFPVFASGNFGGQLQAIPAPATDIKRVEALHSSIVDRVLYIPAPQPLFVGDAHFGGDEPFFDGPGHYGGSSFPQGQLAVALTTLQARNTTAAASILHALGIRYVVSRADVRTGFMAYEPSSAIAADSWKNVPDIRPLGRSPSPGVADLGSSGIVEIDRNWTPSSLDLATDAVGRTSGIVELQGWDAPASRLPPMVVGARSVPAGSVGRVSLVGSDLGIDPASKWVATEARWFENPLIAGLSDGVMTYSAASYARDFTVAVGDAVVPQVAFVRSPQSYALDITIDACHKRVPTHAPIDSIGEILLYGCRLSAGAHHLTVRPYGPSQLSVIASFALVSPGSRPTKLSLAGDAVAGPPHNIDYPAKWTPQTLEHRPSAVMVKNGNRIAVRDAWWLTHHDLALTPGTYRLTIRTKTREGSLSAAIWTRENAVIARMIVDPNRSSDTMDFDIPDGSSRELFFLYADGRTTPVDATIEGVSFQRLTSHIAAGAATPMMARCVTDFPTFQCTADGVNSTFVVLRQSYDSRWELRVNGVPVPDRDHLRAYHYANAWYVGSQRHMHLDFSYGPEHIYRITVWIARGALALCIVVLIVGGVLLLAPVGSIGRPTARNDNVIPVNI